MPAIEDYHSDELSIPPPPLLLFDSRLTPVFSLACSDDDTDLPLPSAPSPPPRAPPAAAPAAGANAANPMAGLQAMMEAMGAGGMMDDPRFAEGAGGGKREKGVEYVEDDGPYKECVLLLLPTLFLSSLEELVRPLSARQGLTSSPPSLRDLSWHPIYPIYLDAKRAFGTSGGRRIPREKAHWWPLVGDLVKGLKALRLPVFVEVRCPLPPSL